MKGMNQMSKTARLGRKPTTRDKVVLILRERKNAISADLGVDTGYMDSLVKKEIVKVVDKIKHQGRGRPMNVYSLTSRGQAFATNAKKVMA